MPRLRRLSFAAVLAAVVFVNAQPADAQIAEQKKVVAFLFGVIHIRDSSGRSVSLEAPLGTGFLIEYPEPRGGPDFGFFYLVTAKHVLKDADGSFLRTIRVRLSLKSPIGDRGYEFVDDVPVADERGRLIWFSHDDPAVDVAVLPFLPDMEKFDFKVIPVSLFADDAFMAREKISEGDSLYFIGLMSQYYGDNQNLPLVRRGTLALMTNEKIETPTGRQSAYIAELSSWPGNSGSPVFLNLSGFRPNGVIVGGGGIKFLGVLVGSFLNRVRATTVDTATVVGGNEFNTGISFIVPAAQLANILESPAAKRQREEELRRKGLVK